MMRLLVLLLIFTLAGCLPKQEVRTAGIADEGQDTDTDDGIITSTSDVDLAWFQSLTSSTILSVHRDNIENTYVRGRRIENYLLRQNAPQASYCLEVDLGTSVPVTDRRFLRLRAVPLSVNNVATKTKTIYLRVDFANTAAGQSVCNLDKVQFTNDSATEYITFSSIQSRISFTLASACSSCVTQIQSSNFKLFTVDSANSRMVQVKPTELDLGLLTLQLKPGNAPNISGTCTSNACSALGFDCCLQNQCVNDGSVRPEVTGAVLTSSAFLSAEQEKLSNSLAFLRYPQFYYICGTAQPQPVPGTGNQTGAEAAAAARLLEMQKDYACIQELKAKSLANPFHLAPFTSSASYDQTKCNTTTTTDAYHWRNVLGRLYTNCGCAAAQNTLELQLANCPKYDYQVLAQNSNLQPIQFACTSLDESGVETPFQNLDVAVNSRAIPHRFFNAAGDEVDPAKNPPSTTTQEGQAFSYADPEKTQPTNGQFNMNSILGELNIELTGAMPAKVVELELDKVYLIATRSGFYTPCPTCAKDSWFASFSAHPTSGQGVGLQGVGHSTSRDGWDNNSTLGNYEDTIFGRACWVPPTMLPFSQPIAGATTATDANIGPQRLARLKTQAAMWINGYQRDWFGFNKGALIGSFDGVTWFAVGKGRIVRSTTKKLFLAINAPFGDLAENNNHVVSVQDFEGQATAALQDFHPDFVQNHPSQNEAGNCQAYHACNVDTDCVTKLGWEYVCADVTQLKTYWPGFDAETAKERAMVSGDQPKSIEGILAQGILPNGSTKRCVYRGAGSICRTDAGNISATELEKRKLLTCAPNFWCADVDSTNNAIPGTATQLNVFNKEVARFARPLEEIPVSNNHLYGRDTNQLGRPLDYVHNKYTTPVSSLSGISDSSVRSTLNTNVTAIDAAANGKVGLCRPGKRLPLPTDVATQWNPFNQHQALDEFSRTDYTNQIASCPANYLALGTSKVASCPIIGDDGNYIHQSTSFTGVSSQGTWSRRAMEQNSCGLETLRNGTITTGMTADQLQNVSPFKLIEGKPLNMAVSVLPGLTRDACLRKPGSACHTDLDCSPNKYHADQVQFFNNSFFGNTANREYYEQSLVCGQGIPKPFISDPEFEDYDITKNVCCREVGKDITTYSAQEASGTNSDATVTATLDPLVSGLTDPTNVGRYERFTHIRNMGTTFPVLTAFDTRNGAGTITSRNYQGALSSNVAIPANVMTPDQWKTLNQANGKTCCGGGWVRKFDDGTTDWTKRDRFRVDVSNFRCLNYITPLATTLTPQASWGISQARIDADYGKYCFDISGSTGNCAQLTIPQGTVGDTSCTSKEFEPAGLNPYSAAFQAQFSTLPGEIAWSGLPVNFFAFFPPVSADTDLETLMDFSVTTNRKNITIAIPSYTGDSALTVEMQRRDSANVLTTRACVSSDLSSVTGPTVNGTCTSGTGCCFQYNSTSRILKLNINTADASFYNTVTPTLSGRYGAKISFVPPGIGNLARPLVKQACSDVHYLDILGKMELAGIPQITYPKILCNNNAERLVPELFSVTDSESNRANFNANTFSFNDSVERRTNFHGLANGAIFSQHDFKCCTPLNKTTKDPATCCSGFGVSDGPDGTGGRTNFTCKLPAGANLSIYMNRFVSNEGTGAHLDVSPLVEADFNSQSGEPLVTTPVNAKLAAIGREVCENGTTRRGGAFGDYAAEPASNLSQGSTVYGIVDSSSDGGTNSSGGGTAAVGYNAFIQGYRWNHHLYCE
jgi:hypothetical protein